jgi:hypothetical protein
MIFLLSVSVFSNCKQAQYLHDLVPYDYSSGSLYSEGAIPPGRSNPCGAVTV